MAMGGGSAMGTALNATGVDFSNSTQAEDFLDEILDDSQYMVDANAYARAFWYGVVVVIAICAISNAISKTTMRMRFVLETEINSTMANYCLDYELLRPRDLVLRRPQVHS